MLPFESMGRIREPPDSGLSRQWEGDLRAQVGVGLELGWGERWGGEKDARTRPEPSSLMELQSS